MSLQVVQVSKKAVLPLYTDIYNTAATYYSFFLSFKIHEEILCCLLLVIPSLYEMENKVKYLTFSDVLKLLKIFYIM